VRSCLKKPTIASTRTANYTDTSLTGGYGIDSLQEFPPKQTSNSITTNN